MKNLVSVILALVMVLAMVCCAEATVMTHEEYVAAELDTEVTIETYVQAHQSWWDSKLTVYAQSEDGAYFIYNMACASADDAALLVPGTKIRVNGYKSEWAGEVEIVDATYEIIEGEAFIPETTDVTAFLGTEELTAYQNMYIAVNGLTVAAANEEGAAFLYSWDGSGSHEGNSDLYFYLTDGENTYSFTVESYLCGNDTEVYAAVEALNVGDVVDVCGYLYWYNGMQPHVTSIVTK